RIDAEDGAPLGQLLGRDVVPRLAGVARDVHEAVVAAGPEQTLGDVRLGQREDGAVDLDAGVVAGDRTAGPLLLGLVVARQVRACRLPRLAAVGRLEQDVGRVVQHRRV